MTISFAKKWYLTSSWYLTSFCHFSLARLLIPPRHATSKFGCIWSKLALFANCIDTEDCKESYWRFLQYFCLQAVVASGVITRLAAPQGLVLAAERAKVWPQQHPWILECTLYRPLGHFQFLIASMVFYLVLGAQGPREDQKSGGQRPQIFQ